MIRDYPPSFHLETKSFGGAWEMAIRFCLQNGMMIKPEEGAKQYTYDMTSKIIMTGSAIHEMIDGRLHPKFPTKAKHLEEYVKEYTREYVTEHNKLPKEKQFEYLYMDRLVNYPFNGSFHFDQITGLKTNLQFGISRRLQAITWIPITDVISNSPPCLQRIWIRPFGNGYCEIHFDWRSRDLFGAWMSNYVGLMNMLSKEILIPLDIFPLKVVDNCNSLHIYQSDWEMAGKV